MGWGGCQRWKAVESRDWEPPAWWVGQDLAIHAGRTTRWNRAVWQSVGEAVRVAKREATSPDALDYAEMMTSEVGREVSERFCSRIVGVVRVAWRRLGLAGQAARVGRRLLGPRRAVGVRAIPAVHLVEQVRRLLVLLRVACEPAVVPVGAQVRVVAIDELANRERRSLGCEVRDGLRLFPGRERAGLPLPAQLVELLHRGILVGAEVEGAAVESDAPLTRGMQARPGAASLPLLLLHRCLCGV